jgi:hypothetical protein
MDWEWYFMRDITGRKRARRSRAFISASGLLIPIKVWSHRLLHEGDIKAKYEKKRFRHSYLVRRKSEEPVEFSRTKTESQALARKVMLALKKIATWDEQGRCWIRCGMGALKADGSIVPNGWNRQPAPIVEPLVTYWLATGDREGLDFARAYADGMMNNLQPDGIRLSAGWRNHRWFPFRRAQSRDVHAVWGVAHLGIVTGESRYGFSKNVGRLVARGTGRLVSAGPDNCNETCCVSDMISVAALIAQSGHPEYFDYAALSAELSARCNSS